MKWVPAQFTLSVTILGFLAAAAPAQVVTHDLVFEANANTDSDGSDGWDFTQLAVAGGGGTLPVSSSSAPGHGSTLNGGGFFNSNGMNQNFGGPVTSVSFGDFTYEIWLRRLGDNVAEGEAQFGGFRKLEGFGNENFVSLAMNGGNPQGIDDQLADVDFRNRTLIREGNIDRIPIPIGQWLQLVITYQDVTSAGLSDGVMSVYTNGHQTPIVTFTNRVHMAAGPGADLEWVTTHIYAASESEKGMPGDIAIVRIYNVTLSPAEVEQNFLADAAKYGLAGAPAAPPVFTSATVKDELGFVFTGDVPGLMYSLECSDNGLNFIKTGAMVRGNGSEQILFDPRGTPTQAFYRITDNAP
jgi:hypothetical protein